MQTLVIASNSEDNISLKLEQLEKDVFRKRPVLKHIYENYGSLSLLEFSKLQTEVPSNKFLSNDRKSELVTAFSESVGNLLGNTIQKSVANQLEQAYAVVTSVHHGPLTDPGFFNSNLLFGLTAQQLTKQENILVLSCANISFDNDSFPRGHSFHTKIEKTYNKDNIVFFPRKVRPLPVYNHAAYTEENLSNTTKQIETMHRDGIISIDERDNLLKIIKDVYAEPTVLQQKTFSQQVTKTNFFLWKKIFGDTDMPNLIYLEQESLVNELLRRFHLNKKTIINQILTDGAYQDLIMKHFDTISGGFSLKQKAGTFLFWAVPQGQKYRIQLWKKGSQLVSADGTYSLNLTDESIKDALDKKELIPSTLLSFIVLSFYYGLTLFGGGGQTTYFTRMKKAYKKFLKDIDQEDEIKLSNNVSTIQQAVPYPALAFLSEAKNDLVPATPFDLLMRGRTFDIQKLTDIANTITVQQVFARAFPSMVEQTNQIQIQEIDTYTNFRKNITFLI